VVNDGLVMGGYFTSADTISFANCSTNCWISNNEPAAQVWKDNNGTNVRYKGTGDVAAAPTLTQTTGSPGLLTFVSATQLTEPIPGNLIAYLLEYSWAPAAAASASGFGLTPPTNWTIAQMSVGMTRNASGEPRATAITGGPANNTFWTDNLTSDAHAIFINVMIKH
jgi:hypothetical protein